MQATEGQSPRSQEPFGLKKGKSKFKIRNKGSKHVLTKKRNVGWNEKDRRQIPLTKISERQA